jgi:DNA-binding NarL/FixJ family response regulator
LDILDYVEVFFILTTRETAFPAANKLFAGKVRAPVNMPLVKSTKRIPVLLAEDHTIVRQGLRLLIEADGDIKIVGEAKTGREAVLLTAALRPGVIVMDIAMPQLNGLQATRQILKAFPETKILILSAHSDSAYVEQVIRSGARGYLVKQSSAEMVAKAIRELHKGRSFFTGAIAKRLQNDYRNSSDGTGLQKRAAMELTSREAELLQLIAEGHVNKQIAFEIGISIKTVEKHRQHLMEKLNIHDIAGLTRFAIASGVIENRIQSTMLC